MTQIPGIWQKIQELAPSRYCHDRAFLTRHIGPHIGLLTIQTLSEQILGVVEVGGATPAVLVVQEDGLGGSGNEVFKLAFYDGPALES